MAVESIILKFDLLEFDRQISGVQRTFTNFGKALQDVISETSGNIKELIEDVDVLSSAMSSIAAQSDYIQTVLSHNLDSTGKSIEDLVKKSAEFAKNLKEASGIDISDVVAAKSQDSITSRTKDVVTTDQDMAMGAAAMNIADQVEESKEAATEALTDVSELVKKAVDEALKAKEESEAAKSVADKAIEAAQRQARQAQQSLSSAGSKIFGNMGGAMGKGLFGGMIALMITGYMERDRIDRERAELRNMFVTTTDAIMREGMGRAVSQLSAFMEKAQHHYGIGRQEVQNVVQILSEGGHGWREFSKAFDTSLGEVGSRIDITTIAMDRMFKQGTGTAAKGINDLVKNYGDSIGEASKKYLDLSFAARRSGMGVSSFTDAVLSSGSALKQYGIDIKDVAATMETIKGHYEEMGLSRQMAGRMAAQATQGLAEGIAGMDIGMTAMVGERLGIKGANPLEVAMKFKEGWRIAQESGNAMQMSTMSKAVSDVFKDLVGGDRSSLVHFATTKGFDFQSAVALADLPEKLAKLGDLQEAGTDELKEFKNTFKRESNTISDIMKNQRDILDGLSKIGEGLLKAVSGLIGVVSTGIKGLTTAISAFAGGELDKLPDIMKVVGDVMDSQIGNITGGMKQAGDGLMQTGKAMGHALGDVFGGLDQLDRLNTPLTDWSVDDLRNEIMDVVTDEGTRSLLADQIMSDLGAIGNSAMGAIFGDDDPFVAKQRVGQAYMKEMNNLKQQNRLSNAGLSESQMHNKAILKVKARIDPEVLRAAGMIADANAH